MRNSCTVTVVRVFVDKKGMFGNPVGIVVDEERKINAEDRLRLAKNLGFSESVFVNNIKTGAVSIYDTQEEVSFAGHAVLGTAWYIRTVLQVSITSIECAGGHVSIHQESDVLWLQVKRTALPHWQLKQLETADKIKSLSEKEIKSQMHTVMWAWIDQAKNVIYARTFAPDWGTPEDEANGSGIMLLADFLNKDITALHGKGSVIFAKKAENGYVEVGGLCSLLSSLFFKKF